ncbi:MAG: hypothetical protein C0481_10775 [Phenylobacterium sp.]|uniref:hypothetical protein n=1 Tax=Phenylobacterium sp. TaxID=1871053 RepID=UPI0025FB4344|nr:hypothetical protein [Phenylobacterium sp.]MBA4012338.1 hypothetical protein [Phenylobacterium sp.]
MNGHLHERLDAKIGELRAAGVAITRIDASPQAIEQLFVGKGEGAILFDADPARDTAWYGDVELQACAEPGARLLVVGADGPQNIEI